MSRINASIFFDRWKAVTWKLFHFVDNTKFEVIYKPLIEDVFSLLRNVREEYIYVNICDLRRQHEDHKGCLFINIYIC